MSDLTNKDSEQDAKLAVLESKIESYRERIIALEEETKDVSVIESTLENAIRRIEMVHSRIDKTEERIKEIRQQTIDNKIWIQRASAVIGAAVTLIGIIVAMPQDADSKEMNYGSNDPAKQEINRVVDGDTIDVTIDLGFDLYKKERVRVAGVDTPEKRTRDLEEKELGIHATNWLKEKLDSAISGDDDLIIRTELVGGMGKYGRLLGWLYIGDSELSLNEQMIDEGYAWEYDGGTKQKNFEELREIRRAHGTLV
jgi:endonuclease YncB( thermonuclease family)